MLRKVILSTLAACGLMATAVAPTQAYPHYTHHGNPYHHEYRHYRSWPCRTFTTWSAANSWIEYQRRCGCECHYEWQGPVCCVYYR
jgi:hypothetical protein